jgi:hypothetical protein
MGFSTACNLAMLLYHHYIFANFSLKPLEKQSKSAIGAKKFLKNNHAEKIFSI